MRPPQRLPGQALVAGLLLLGGEQPGQQGASQFRPGQGGQVGHVRGIVGQPPEVMPGQLIAAERRATERGGGRAPLSRIEIEPDAAAAG